MSTQYTLVKHLYRNLDTISLTCPGKEALFLIFFSLFSNKQDTVSGEQTHDEYVGTLADISRL